MAHGNDMKKSPETLADYRGDHCRPKGFIDSWRPQKKTVARLVAIDAVLAEYHDHLPLTERQIFYRLVGNHGYQKTENGYESLTDLLSRARRSGRISFDAIRDDGVTRYGLTQYADAAAFIAAARDDARRRFVLHRQAGQSVKLYLWCEASGMVPQLSRLVGKYGISVLSSGGFDSVSMKYSFAREIADTGCPVVVLHVGDHDASGCHAFLALADDVMAFCDRLGGHVQFERVAVLPQHVNQYGLPTAPPKASDRRKFTGETVQAEALAPDDLASIVLAAVEQHFDLDIWREVLAAEDAARIDLIRALDALDK
jgi:hypothetical protein